MLRTGALNAKGGLSELGLLCATGHASTRGKKAKDADSCFEDWFQLVPDMLDDSA